MPLIPYTGERDERRLLVILYFGTLALLLILLYATFTNLQRYTDSVRGIRRYNFAQIELNGLLSSLQDQEASVRGYLLTNDTAYLQPFHVAKVRDSMHFAEVDSLLAEGSWQAQLGWLKVKYTEVESLLESMITDSVGTRIAAEVDLVKMGKSKAAMDEVRQLHARLVAQIQLERDDFLETEVRDGLDAPVMLILYSVLAIAATALLFSRLSRALLGVERSKLMLQTKLGELDEEVRNRTSIQSLLQKVLDTSPNGIMTFRSVRNAEGAIIDFEFRSSNLRANAIVGRQDLVGKRLLTEMPGNGSSGLFDGYVDVATTGVPFRNELYYKGEGMNLWFSTHAVRFEDGFMVTFSDITEQKHAQEVNAEADRIALTGQITRTVAHEVRNPLTNIHLAVEQLHDEVQDRDELVQPFFQIIDRNLKRIGTLIKEMLESSKKRELDLVACTLDEIVHTALKHVNDRLELKGIKSEIDLTSDLPTVMADRELIDLAITNIAVNAVEAMEPGKGHLHMGARRVGDEVLLEITDNGKGIPPENVSRLFEPFYSGRTGGLGLGLTTTRSILNSHRVKLEVQSAVGQGTTFTLRFPSEVFVTGTGPAVVVAPEA
ncbi:MAG: CHASE3 domain-containing protein [Flavobacteriales bacterium]|nr:CHASE3 domain-containing protein [Flavobacteriales bacterium]